MNFAVTCIDFFAAGHDNFASAQAQVLNQASCVCTQFTTSLFVRVVWSILCAITQPG